MENPPGRLFCEWMHDWRRLKVVEDIMMTVVVVEKENP
jgi:hypothetical protein